MNILGVQLNFYASEIANLFYAARVSWPKGPYYQQVRVAVFFRPAFRKRVASYSMVAYQHGINAGYAAVERDFDSVLAFMQEHGYGGEAWEVLRRETFHHHIAPIDQEPLWTAGYGIVRSRNVEELGRVFDEDILDLSNHPF